MKKELYIVDLLAEKGHVPFIQNIIEILKEQYDIVFISSSSYCELVKHENQIPLNNQWFEFSNKYFFVLKQLFLTGKVRRLFRPETSILVTGFENISFSLGWRNTKSNPTYAFLHNNLDKKGLSEFFFKKINKGISFFVFENYIREHLINRIENNVFYTPHPIHYANNSISSQKEEDFIFSVNVDTTTSSFKLLANYAETNGLKLFAKSNKSYRSAPFLMVKSYFEDYMAMIEKAVFVVVSAPYAHRVSGVFYECMAMNKKIFFADTADLFPIEMQKMYPNNVIIGNLNQVDTIVPNNSNFIFRHSNLNIQKIIINAIQ